jgi:hypothetical protein
MGVPRIPIQAESSAISPPYSPLFLFGLQRYRENQPSPGRAAGMHCSVLHLALGFAVKISQVLLHCLLVQNWQSRQVFRPTDILRVNVHFCK